jgi:hypothetical protein
MRHLRPPSRQSCLKIHTGLLRRNDTLPDILLDVLFRSVSNNRLRTIPPHVPFRNSSPQL